MTGETCKKDFFTSRYALMLSVMGIAIGTGNIWRFPRIIAQNGGGSFIIPCVYRGIAKGIEKANFLLIPLLFLILVFAAFKSLMLPGSMEGVKFLFTPHIGDLLDYRIWLEALTQSAWSTGAGWGLILTYAVYMKQKEGIFLNSILTGVGDSIASLLAAAAIIPVIFSVLPHNHVERALEAGNTGLTFIWIPQLFEHIQGGYTLMLLFFITLCFAALSYVTIA